MLLLIEQMARHINLTVIAALGSTAQGDSQAASIRGTGNSLGDAGPTRLGYIPLQE